MAYWIRAAPDPKKIFTDQQTSLFSYFDDQGKYKFLKLHNVHSYNINAIKSMLKWHEIGTNSNLILWIYCSYLGLPEERPGQADELTLTHRQILPAL